MKVSENRKVNVAVSVLFYATVAIGLIGFVVANWCGTLFSETAGNVITWCSAISLAFAVVFVAGAVGICSGEWYWWLISSFVWIISGFVLSILFLLVIALDHVGIIALSDAIVRCGVYKVMIKCVLFIGLICFGLSFCGIGLKLIRNNKSISGALSLFSGACVCFWSGFFLFKFMGWSADIVMMFKIIGYGSVVFFILTVIIAAWDERHRLRH